MVLSFLVALSHPIVPTNVNIFAASVSSFRPSALSIGSIDSLTVEGGDMPLVSGDPRAFVLATASCAVPSPSSPLLVSGVTTTNNGSGNSVSVTIDSTAATGGGDFRLCARWTTSSPYLDIGPISLVSVTALVPPIIPVSASPLSVNILGAGLVNVSTDPFAIVVSSVGCPSGQPLAPAVASVSSALGTPTSIVMSVDDHNSTSGVFSVCMRLTSSSAYFDTLQTLTIGVFIIRFSAS